MPTDTQLNAKTDVTAHRNESKSVKKLVSNINPKYYMNVGSWGDNGKTDFALISGRVLVLGSWLSLGENMSTLPSTPPSSNYESDLLEQLAGNQKIFEFFKAARLIERGFFRDCEIIPAAEFKFCEETELIIVVGDCHINVLKEWGPDNFVYIPDDENDDRTRASIWPYFKEFVKFASEHTSKENLIQIGDLYDIWEAQNIFEHAAYILLTLMESFKPDLIFGQKAHNYKEFIPELLSFSDRFTSDSNREFDWNQSDEKYELSKIAKTPLSLARYFGCDDPAPIYSGPIYDSPYDIDGYPEEHYSSLAEWQKQAYRKFYESKPTIRDALALLFYGEASHGKRYPFSKFTTPAELKISGEAGLQNEVHFIRECEKLGMKDTPCDFLACEDIKKLIEAQYESASSTFSKMTLMVGNHDISDAEEGGKYKNQYLDLLFREGLSRAEVLLCVATAGSETSRTVELEGQVEVEFSENESQPRTRTVSLKQQNRMDPESKLDDKYLSYRRGVGAKIVLEHGMSWDVYNNPVNYSLTQVHRTNPASPFPMSAPEEDVSYWFTQFKWLDGGYHACRGWTVGDPYSILTPYHGDMYDAKVQGGSEKGKTLVLPQADFELGLACESRMDDIFEKNKDVALVIMGHTHNPFIVKWQDWKWDVTNWLGVSPLMTTQQGLDDAIGFNPIIYLCNKFAKSD